MTLANLTGVVGQTGVTQTRHMTVFQGMREGVSGCAVTATATDRRVSVAPGTVWFPGGSVDVTVAHADATTTADAQSAAGVRIDTLVMRFATGGNPVTAALAWVKGTASTGTPQPPALTRVKGGTWEVPLADARLVQGQGVFTAPDLTDRRLSPAGLAFHATTIDALRDNNPGALCTVGGQTYSCGADGVTWTPVVQQQNSQSSYTPNVTGLTGALVKTLRWHQVGPEVHIRCRIAAPTSGSTAKTGEVAVSLPFNHNASPAIRAVGTGVWRGGGGDVQKPISVYVEPGSSTARVTVHTVLDSASSDEDVRLYAPSSASVTWSVASGSHFDFSLVIFP